MYHPFNVKLSSYRFQNKHIINKHLRLRNISGAKNSIKTAWASFHFLALSNNSNWFKYSCIHLALIALHSYTHASGTFNCSMQNFSRSFNSLSLVTFLAKYKRTHDSRLLSSPCICMSTNIAQCHMSREANWDAYESQSVSIQWRDIVVEWRWWCWLETTRAESSDWARCQLRRVSNWLDVWAKGLNKSSILVLLGSQYNLIKW